MHIGMIGGIGPAATDYYYRNLIRRAAEQPFDLECTIVHADTPTLLGNMVAGRPADQVAIYRRLTDRLAAAGAGCVAVTSISGHFCIDEFSAVSPLPVVDLLDEVATELQTREIARVGLLGTSTVMGSRMYGRLGPTEVVVPHGDELDAVGTAYIEMATAGAATAAHRAVFDRAIDAMLADGAETVLLGGTDLVLLFDEGSDPVLDCARVHVDALAALAAR